MENKALEMLNIDELQEFIEKLEEENQILKEQILEKKDILEELIDIME